jgi:hypothetical protein
LTKADLVRHPRAMTLMDDLTGPAPRPGPYGGSRDAVSRAETDLPGSADELNDAMAVPALSLLGEG